MPFLLLVSVHYVLNLIKLHQILMIKGFFEISFEPSMDLIIKEAESLFLLILAQRQSVRGGELRLSSIELHKLFFELLT